MWAYIRHESLAKNTTNAYWYLLAKSLLYFLGCSSKFIVTSVGNVDL